MVNQIYDEYHSKTYCACDREFTMVTDKSKQWEGDMPTCNRKNCKYDKNDSAMSVMKESLKEQDHVLNYMTCTNGHVCCPFCTHQYFEAKKSEEHHKKDLIKKMVNEAVVTYRDVSGTK